MHHGCVKVRLVIESQMIFLLGLMEWNIISASEADIVFSQLMPSFNTFCGWESKRYKGINESFDKSETYLIFFLKLSLIVRN